MWILSNRWFSKKFNLLEIKIPYEHQKRNKSQQSYIHINRENQLINSNLSINAINKQIYEDQLIAKGNVAPGFTMQP